MDETRCVAAFVALALAVCFIGQVSGANKVTIDAAFNNAEGVVLISGNEKLQIKTNGGNGKETSLGPMENTMPVQAAFMSREQDAQILLYGRSNGQVFVVGKGPVKKLKYGIGARKFIRHGGPDAAGARGGTVYFFKGCEMVIRHKWNSWSKPENVEEKGLPCTPDAAWSDGEDMIILKGDQIWRWTKSEEVIGPCPFSGTYSITSWELTPNSEVKGKVCPQGWSLYCPTSKCFKVFKDNRDTLSASGACKKNGGNLATIRNVGEQNVVGSLVHNQGRVFIIGANDRAREGDFRWFADNSKVTYSNWNHGEPNNSGNKEDCAQIYGGNLHWNDMPCNLKYPYVCERHAD